MGKLVTVIGTAVASEEEREAAFRLGQLLAENGFDLLCGGMGGVMEAACEGAKKAGGLTIGILPGSDPASGNRWLDVAVPTGMGSMRNRIVALAGRAVVAIGGRYGTLSEIAFALDAGRRVCSIGGWSSIGGVRSVSSPEEALDFVKSGYGGEDA